jgi:hypothetical protein
VLWRHGASLVYLCIVVQFKFLLGSFLGLLSGLLVAKFAGIFDKRVFKGVEELGVYQDITVI